MATKADGGTGERIVFKSFHERVDENGTPISPPLLPLTHASPFFRIPFIHYGWEKWKSLSIFVWFMCLHSLHVLWTWDISSGKAMLGSFQSTISYLPAQLFRMTKVAHLRIRTKKPTLIKLSSTHLTQILWTFMCLIKAANFCHPGNILTEF